MKRKPNKDAANSEQLDAYWLADQIAGESGNGRARPQLVARAFGDMHAAHTASGRRYPFYWWRGNGSPTRYAMKSAVAELLRQARRATSGRSETHRYWWEGESSENVFIEITRRDDIGADLKAPAAAPVPAPSASS